jgi:aspartyl protease family protein
MSLVYLLLVLVMVASALMTRRLPLGQTAKMAGAWILIFGAAFLVFTLRDDFRALWNRVVSETRGVEQGEGGELRVRKSDDGHFWVDAKLDGESVRFMVDSGATVTTISAETARRAGIEPQGLYPVLVETANGTVQARRGRAGRLTVGPIERADFAVHISPTLGETDLLGMNFLSTLSSWRVEGQWLVLKP